MKKLLNLCSKRICSALVAAFILALALCMGYGMDKHGTLSVSFPAVIAFAGVLAVSFAAVVLVYALFDRLSEKEKKEVSVNGVKVFFISFAVLIVLYLIQFLAVYPGLFIFDATWQLDTFRAGEVSEHHPVLHTVILAFLVDTFASDEWHINLGVAAYTLVQLVLFAASAAYMLTYVFKKVRNRVVYVICLLFMGLYTPVFLQVVSVTKDSYFLIFIMLAVTLSLEFAEAPVAFVKAVPKVVLWTVSVTLISIFRNNCLYAVPFLLVALFFVLKEKRPVYLGMVAAGAILYVLYKVLFVPAFVTKDVDGREFYSVPAQQLARVYNYDSADITDGEKKTIESLIGEAGLKAYITSNADPVKSALDMTYFRAHEAEIRSLYLSLLVRNPKLYFEAFLANTLGFWYPETELTLHTDGRTGYWVIGCYPYAVLNSKCPPLLKYFELFGSDTPVTENPLLMPFFAPATFLYLFILMFVYGIEKKKKPFIPVFVFILFLWATYLLGPLAMVRYANYLYGIVPLYFVMIMGEAVYESQR